MKAGLPKLLGNIGLTREMFSRGHPDVTFRFGVGVKR